jgi:hypothetical protein
MLTAQACVFGAIGQLTSWGREMKTRTWALAAVVAAAGLAASNVSATVYTVFDTVGAGGVTGSITTTGALGVLGSSAITDWNLTLSDGSSTFNLRGPLSGADSGLLNNSGTALTATATGLFFNFGSTAGSFLLFEAAPITGGNFWCVNDAASPCGSSFGASSSDELVRLSGTAVRQSFVGVTQIASVGSPPPPGGGIPEPATWTMMILGFGGLGALLRRRRRSAAAFT